MKERNLGKRCKRCKSEKTRKMRLYSKRGYKELFCWECWKELEERTPLKKGKSEGASQKISVTQGMVNSIHKSVRQELDGKKKIASSEWKRIVMRSMTLESRQNQGITA